MPNVSGNISKISSRDVNTSFGTKKAYSVQLNGDWYSAGFKRPQVSEGDFVNLTFEMKGEYKNATNIVKAEAGGPVASGAPTKSAPSGGGGFVQKVFPVPPLHPDRSIVRQSSLKAAVEFLNFSKKPGTATADDVIEIARKFEAYSCGDLDLAEAKKEIESTVGGLDE